MIPFAVLTMKACLATRLRSMTCLGGSFPFGFEEVESVDIEVMEEEGLLSLTNKQVGIGAVEQETVMDGRLCRPCFDDH
jgi:hypothetical protein